MSEQRALRDLNSMWFGLLFAYVASAVVLVVGVDIQHLVTVVLVITVPPALAFPILYHRMYNWRRTWIGQSLMIKSIGVAMVLFLTSLRQVFGDYPFRQYLVYAFFVWISVGTVSRIVALFKDRQPPVEDLENPSKRSVSEN